MSLHLLCFLALGVPLISAAVSAVIAFYDYHKGAWINTCAIGISALGCLGLYLKIAAIGPQNIDLLQWISTPLLSLPWGLQLDSLSTTMMLLVSFIAFLVHIYSISYLHLEPDIMRFFCYLNLFTFMMLVLVSAPNLLQMFCGWEGVGLTSYLLINYWYKKPKAGYASIKAFVVNRIGDLGFVLGMGLLLNHFHTLDFKAIYDSIHLGVYNDSTVINLSALFLFIGAMGKSGQFGLHVWLPDAMEAPTPVSALLHAATMVTAGVYLVVRLNPLFSAATIMAPIIITIGLATAIFAGLVGYTQTDIKKIIAYSTCSQLGFMFVACGVGAYHVAFFHLFTHAFFKALLFLGAGSVIHSLSHEQNILNMGGMRKLIPFTYWCMLIGSASLMGMPFLAGYYSKDLIFESLFGSGDSFDNLTKFTIIGSFLIAALLSSLYSCRLLYYVFFGKSRTNERILAHMHDQSLSMTIPMIVLAVGAIIAGYFGQALFIKQTLGFSWNGILQITPLPHLHQSTLLLPLIASLTGIVMVYSIYKNGPALADKFKKSNKKLYEFFYNKCYIDWFYDEKITKGSVILGELLYTKIDRGFIDKYGPNGISNTLLKISQLMSTNNSGSLQLYLQFIVIFLFVIVGGYLLFSYYPHLLLTIKMLIGQI